jgi:predicted dehydrogenase
MKLCAVSESFGNLSFKEAAKVSAILGLEALEIGTGNWSAAPHANLPSLLESKEKRQEFLSVFEGPSTCQRHRGSRRKANTVYDVVESAAKSLAADSGASVAHSAEEAFDRPDVAAALVATSSNTHVEFIVKAVQAGKAVMCEKPLAPNLSDAQKCIDALGTEATNVFLAFNRRFDPTLS